MKNLVGQTFGHYHIEASLGNGSMGQVFRGKQGLDRPIAVKVIHDHLATTPTFRARFLQELKAPSALKHPHIAEIYEFGELDGTLYLFMELLTDGTLSTFLQQCTITQFEPMEQGRHRLILGLDLIRQAAEGLVVAHTQGVIHQHIRPENLRLKRLSRSDQAGEQYQLKITNFGLAHLSESEGLCTDTLTSTLAYMSPEQCQHKKLDGRSDLYSLGVVLYEVVTGCLPFQMNTVSDALHKHANTLPLPPQQVYPDLPSLVEQIILRCLAKMPQERYQTGRELADTLQEAINHISRQTTGPLVPSFPLSPPPSEPPRIRISDLSGQTIRAAEVTRWGLIIGSQEDCDMVLSAETVSPHHLQVKWDGHQTTITDLTSSHGTKLGDEQLVPQVSWVWEEKQTVSIGPFLLYLEESNTSELPFMNSPFMPQPPETEPLPQAAPSPVVHHHIGVHVAPDKLMIAPTQPSARERSPQTTNTAFKNTALIPNWFLSLAILVLAGIIVPLTIIPHIRDTATSTLAIHFPVPTPTPTIDPNSPTGIAVLTLATAGTPILSDPLVAQSDHNWDEDKSCTFTQGAYQATNLSSQNNTYTPCYEKADTLTNFAYEVQMIILQGDGGGVIFRDDGAKHNYLFLVHTDGSYQLQINGGQPQINGSSTAFIKGENNINTLDVVVLDKNIHLYINGQFVNSFSGQVSNAGTIGVLAYKASNPTTVKYSKAKVWKLP